MEKQPHFLIIDDSENILTLIKTMFEIEGWKVSTLDNIDHIVEKVKQIMPDAILSDMLLSGANGCDACRDIKATESLSHISITMMSAHPLAGKNAKDAGADYFVEKPFELDDLIETMKKAVQLV